MINSAKNFTTTVSKLTDKELYESCKKFGSTSLEALRKFAGLLPEVLKRDLYRKKGFHSIFEFAARLAGMSKNQVELVLKLDKKFEDKPILHKALISGEVSANKLIRIVSLATKENQMDLYEKTRLLSNRAVEVFVKDVKRENQCEDTQSHKTSLFETGKPNKQESFSKPLSEPEKMHVHNSAHTLKLDKDVEKELLEMQEKGININEFLRSALEKRKEEIKNRKDKISEAITFEATSSKTKENSRYIPVEIRRIIIDEHGTKCSYPGCHKPVKILHHTKRFALARNHDPHFIAPLCEAHHEIAHTVDLKYTRLRLQN